MKYEIVRSANISEKWLALLPPSAEVICLEDGLTIERAAAILTGEAPRSTEEAASLLRSIIATATQYHREWLTPANVSALSSFLISPAPSPVQASSPYQVRREGPSIKRYPRD